MELGLDLVLQARLGLCGLSGLGAVIGGRARDGLLFAMHSLLLEQTYFVLELTDKIIRKTYGLPRDLRQAWQHQSHRRRP